MIIELFRAWSPKDMKVDTCGICGQEIAPTPVIASAATEDRWNMGVACMECVAYLGSRNPEKCPTREQYEEALRRFPRPMYESEEALRTAAGDEDPGDFIYEDSWIWQVAR